MAGIQKNFGRFLVAGGISVLFFPGSAWAELRFDKTSQELRARPQDATVEATFKFRNAGTKPVEIVSVKSSCDCTTVALEKKDYAPGEGGSIQAVFTVGERTGDQFKQITVRTSGGSEAVQRLSFLVRLPTLVQITPVALFWKQGQPAAPKEVAIEIPEKDFPATAVRATSAKDGVNLQLETVTEHRSYRLKVTPRSTGEPAREEIAIEVEFPGLGTRHYRGFAYVK